MDVVKVTLGTETVASPASPEATVNVTLAVGALLSTAVNDAVAPDSFVVNPLVGVTVMPGSGAAVMSSANSEVSVKAVNPALLLSRWR